MLCGVLSSAVGNGAPLAALQEPEALGRALRAAAAAGLMAPLKALLGRSEEVAVDAKTRSCATALMAAAQGGHAAAVAALLEAGAEVEAKTNNGMTALMLAAEGGHTAAVEALLAAGAEVEAKDNDGRTALMFAAHGGHAAAIAALVAAAAEVEAKDNDGATALMHAEQVGHAAAIAALLEAGAEVDAKMPPRHPARRSLPTLPDLQYTVFGATAPSMRGPLPTSNWVVPGLLLCGAEPDGPAALRLVMLGVRVFVCLQSELPSDRPLPYRAHAERGSSSADDEPLEFVHEPTTFREETLRGLVERVAAAVRVGRPVYVHCRRGNDRTGVVVACVLGELYPALTAAEVLGRVQAYHDARANHHRNRQSAV